ncbi:hypothetical protein [Candidatus Electrothrix sp.]|uniref:hypothetical protein n=1 Tax=Candidatus Electrothrix sp. TaxID=2170559 RepID=UPI004055DBCD
MAYSKFTLKDAKEKLGLQIVENEKIFSDDNIKPAPISDYLQTTLAEFAPLALSINTEKSRSEWIIAPIMAELRRELKNTISLFSGFTFTVDEGKELDGKCDYIISLNPEQFYITAPVITIVEAKKENIVQGLGQCIATMYAADLYNKQEGTPIPCIYGCVTSGTTWKFMKFSDNTAYIDIDEYYLKEIESLMGILLTIVRSEQDAVKS